MPFSHLTFPKPFSRLTSVSSASFRTIRTRNSVTSNDRHFSNHACDAHQREIVERHPWVPNNLMKAFNQAKEHAYRRVLNPRNVALAWVRNAFEEQLGVLGYRPLGIRFDTSEPQDTRHVAALLFATKHRAPRAPARRPHYRRRWGQYSGGDLAQPR